MRIYLTHCSAEKNPDLKDSGVKVTPDFMYVAPALQAFMNRCKEKQVNWAILSDLYGIWLPNIKHEWYEKHPDTVTEAECNTITNHFERSLNQFDEIWFYVRPETFHPFYQAVLSSTLLKDRVRQFTDLAVIE